MHDRRVFPMNASSGRFDAPVRTSRWGTACFGDGLLWCGVAAFCGSAVFVILPTGDRVSVRGREHILRDDLGAMRWGIRQFKVTNGGLPRDLQDLVDAGLLRGVPHDPITGSDATWTLMRNQGAGGCRRPIWCGGHGNGRDKVR